jgi:membrane protein
MPSPVARAKALLQGARDRWPLLDHAVRMQQHYSRVNGSGLAGSVTYYAFLSFFPILALAFFVVGYISKLYPHARDNLVSAVGTLLPNILGNGEGEIRLSSIQHAAGTAGLFGALGLLYSGLGWLAGMRAALEVVFEMPRSQYPSFVSAKLRDLAFLVVIGLTLLLSVALTGVVTASSNWLLDLVGLGHDLAWLVRVLGGVVGIGANTLLFYTLFRLLARPVTPRRALRQGAILGALGFEALKLGSTLLLVSSRGKPAFQALGIALILVVWINYFSRVVMYAAAWAHTSAPARAARESTLARARSGAPSPAPVPAATSAPRTRRSVPGPRLAFGAGVASALGLVALLRRRRG